MNGGEVILYQRQQGFIRSLPFLRWRESEQAAPDRTRSDFPMEWNQDDKCVQLVTRHHHGGDPIKTPIHLSSSPIRSPPPLASLLSVKFLWGPIINTCISPREMGNVRSQENQSLQEFFSPRWPVTLSTFDFVQNTFLKWPTNTCSEFSKAKNEHFWSNSREKVAS